MPETWMIEAWDRYGKEWLATRNQMIVDSYRPEGADNTNYVRVLAKMNAIRDKETPNAT